MSRDYSRYLRTASRLLVAAGLVAASGCDSGDTTPPPQQPAARSAAPAAPASSGPTVTADLPKMMRGLAEHYAIQAKFLESMTSGKTLSASDSQAYWEAQAAAIKACNDIVLMLRENPRWKRQTTEALEKYTKSQIIMERKAKVAFDAACKSGKAGKFTGSPSAEDQQTIQKYMMAEMQVKGTMSYSRAEMEGP